MKLKFLSIIGFFFLLLSSVKIANTYQRDLDEAIFEGILLATITSYHGATLST